MTELTAEEQDRVGAGLVYLSALKEQRRPQRQPRKGYVYALQAKDGTGPIKIGYTTDVSERVKALQIGSPIELQLLGSCEATQRVERKLHRRLAEERLHGEWFEPTVRVKRWAEVIDESDLLDAASVP